MIGEAVDAAHRIIIAATLWAGAIGGAAALVVVAVLYAGLPLGVWARIGLRRGCAPAGAPQRASRGSRDAGEPHSPADGRTEPRRARQPQETQ